MANTTENSPVTHWVLGCSAGSVVRGTEQDSNNSQINDEVRFVVEIGNVLKPYTEPSN